MRKLTKSEITVLGCLIHMESWDTLISETGFHTGALRDDITNLLSVRFIEAVETASDRIAPVRSGNSSRFYDLDNLNRYSFRITAAGQKALGRKS